MLLENFIEKHTLFRLRRVGVVERVIRYISAVYYMEVFGILHVAPILDIRYIPKCVGYGSRLNKNTVQATANLVHSWASL